MNKREQIQHYRNGLGPINTEGYPYIDTKNIQMKSLINFATALGYEFFQICNIFYKEDFKGSGFKGCDTISLTKMVELHNTAWVETEIAGYFAPYSSRTKKLGGGYYNKAFYKDAYTIKQALAARVVVQVFLHQGKYDVLCYKNQIKFLEKGYEDLFLRPLIHKESAK